MNIKQVIINLCNEVPGGRSAVAGALGMELSSFNNRLYEKNKCRFFSVDELEAIEDIAGKPFLAEYFAKRQGGVFTKLPDADELDAVELFNLSVHADAKKALLSLVVSKAIEDGVIDGKEKEQILNCLHQFFGSKKSEILALLKVYQK
ncbi:YmfL family putative regulatory protein [Thorsellia kenyensis]|uniref:YmfL family putative regulatory protein n=1 Tax=Thorsellia kenyensis TaxID=1549888 RepID=A0ABV6CA69_9GAMM